MLTLAELEEKCPTCQGRAVLYGRTLIRGSREGFEGDEGLHHECTTCGATGYAAMIDPECNGRVRFPVSVSVKAKPRQLHRDLAEGYLRAFMLSEAHQPEAAAALAHLLACLELVARASGPPE